MSSVPRPPINPALRAAWVLLLASWQRAVQAEATADALRTELAQVTAQRDALAQALLYYREEMEQMRGDPRAPL